MSRQFSLCGLYQPHGISAFLFEACRRGLPQVGVTYLNTIALYPRFRPSPRPRRDEFPSAKPCGCEGQFLPWLRRRSGCQASHEVLHDANGHRPYRCRPCARPASVHSPVKHNLVAGAPTPAPNPPVTDGHGWEAGLHYWPKGLRLVCYHRRGSPTPPL